MMALAEDRVANKVLRECCQDILDHINVDLVIFRLYSKCRLTVQEVSHLQSIQTAQERKEQLYMRGLADKGSAAFKDILEVLNDTSDYKPHADLADKLSKRHRCLSQRLSQSHPCKHHSQVNTALTRITKRKETITPCLESQFRYSDDDDSDDDDDNDDDDNDSDQFRSRAQSLPDVAIVATAKTSQSRKSRVKQKNPAAVVDRRTGYGATVEPAANRVLSLSVGSSSRVTRLSSSIQNTSDPTRCRPPSSVKTPALISTGQPVGVSRRLDQSETANLVTSTVVKKKSGFSDSFISSEPTILIKSPVPLPNMINIKLILLGDSGVGKTSLAQRYLHGIYLHRSPLTLGSKLDECYCQHMQKGINIRLSVWDTAGQERFNWMSPIYYRNAHAAIVVFDMTEPGTLHSASNWKIELSRHLSNDDAGIPVLLVGNKSDSTKVSNDVRRRAQQMAERMSFDDFIESSAKNNHKVEGIFEKAVSLALEYYRPPEDGTIIVSSNQSISQQQQQQQQQQQRQNSRCKC